MDYSQVLSDIYSNTDIIIKLLELGVGLLFAFFLTRNRRYLK